MAKAPIGIMSSVGDRYPAEFISPGSNTRVEDAASSLCFIDWFYTIIMLFGE